MSDVEELLKTQTVPLAMLQMRSELEVADLVEVLREGGTVPPIIVDRDLFVVSGFRRVEANRALTRYGIEAVMVDVRNPDTETLRRLVLSDRVQVAFAAQAAGAQADMHNRAADFGFASYGEYQRTRRVVTAVREDPSLRHLQVAMDEAGNPGKMYREVMATTPSRKPVKVVEQETPEAETTRVRSGLHYRTQRFNSTKASGKALTILEGVVSALGDVVPADIDEETRTIYTERLSKCVTSLRKVLKDMAAETKEEA